MYNYQELINALNSSEEETFWFGAVTEDQIEKLESLLSVKIPREFSDFLLSCGGGGVIESEISGIEDNDASISHGGTVYFNTSYARNEFGLPSYYIVIYLKDDEVCWCIDCSQELYGQIISYDIFKRKPSNRIAMNFYDFFNEYVELRT
ncbi:SMI1/KNR4 family protein [Serratia aquatilis]|uniref:SMI1/KNR4 family protein n=1 Tax=Serratia aquatilis TaxID=1737515 RepID=A0ABV6EHJ4_9GAMM